jgi:hypothetical protein
MNARPALYSISDWWNYSPSARDALAGGSLYEAPMDGRTGTSKQEEPPRDEPGAGK